MTDDKHEKLTVIVHSLLNAFIDSVNKPAIVPCFFFRVFTKTGLKKSKLLPDIAAAFLPIVNTGFHWRKPAPLKNIYIHIRVKGECVAKAKKRTDKCI